MTFVNRIDELAALEERWSSNRGEYFVLYGRRRVGKSHLLLHFGETHRQLYFEATSGSTQDHLEDLSGELAALTGREIYSQQSLANWRAAFAAFAELLAEGPVMIVLDEFQYIARREPEIGSLLNRFIREHASNAGLFLCLSGSDVSFFEKEMGYGSTTYGRRTGSQKLTPFGWSEIEPFLKGWSVEDQIRAWAVFGGIPYYLDEIVPSTGLDQAILRSVLYPDGLLRDEPRFLLAQESRIRDTDYYMSCLRAIAGGKTRLNEIALHIGKSRGEEARPFLETLEEMELIERRYPVTQASGKKVFYAIGDPFLRFWFRFVARRESRLHTRSGAERYLNGTVLPELDKFVSEDAFELVCQQWTLEHLADAVDVGRWWGSIRRTENGELRSRQYEADVAAVDESGAVIALGSCKWPDQATANHEHPATELTKLETIRQEIDAPDARLLFFDRVAFSPRLKELSREREDIELVRVKDMRKQGPGESAQPVGS